MQLLHALDLGTDSKMDKLAEAWMHGTVKPWELRTAIAHTESKARAALDVKMERDRIAAIRKAQCVQQDVVEEDDEELLALLTAIEEIQDANKERIAKH